MLVRCASACDQSGPMTLPVSMRLWSVIDQHRWRESLVNGRSQARLDVVAIRKERWVAPAGTRAVLGWTSHGSLRESRL